VDTHALTSVACVRIREQLTFAPTAVAAGRHRAGVAVTWLCDTSKRAVHVLRLAQGRRNLPQRSLERAAVAHSRLDGWF